MTVGDRLVPNRVGLAVSSFNAPITAPMRDAAHAVLSEAGVAEIPIFEVLGALELPVAALALIERGGCAGVVAIGAVIKGETDHYTYVAGEATR
ncbi:MAG: 6,7-dimethyl-8-ribityllumazine synthase, partial [Acidimicrobiia bacterium]